MGIEIERKYLVDKVKWDELKKVSGKFIRQGYILTDPNKTIRIRIIDNDAFLTIKSLQINITRQEFEYNIPVKDANELLNIFTVSEIIKTRYEIIFLGKTWEVDVFHGDNEGLIIAEIELADENEMFDLPGWVSTEVTHEKKYYNSNLSVYPFIKWKN